MGAAVVTTVSQAMFTGLGYVFVRRGLRQDLAALAVAEAAAFDAEIDRELQPASAGNGEEER